MSNDDDALGTALWLVAGGAAGYAAGRLLVAPQLSKQAPTPPASSRPPTLPAPSVPAPRALASGTSDFMMPSDPYAGQSGSSFTMQPIDPYADAAPSVISAPTSTITLGPTTSGPIRMPSLVDLSAPSSSATSGPITRPSQVDTQPTPAPSVPSAQGAPNSSTSFATSPLVRRFDSVFARYRGTIPIEYVRALVERESKGQPGVRAGSAIGLMQIVPVVLSDYNKRHGSAYTGEHLTDPATNVAIGCELVRIIVESYRKNHPRIVTLQTDWNNLRFVELLTLGWSAGFSEAGGVGRVARYLEGLGATEIDVGIDQFSAHAKRAGAIKYLSDPATIAWCKSVAALYQRERAAARTQSIS
jgi:hypothetical protein